MTSLNGFCLTNEPLHTNIVLNGQITLYCSNIEITTQNYSYHGSSSNPKLKVNQMNESINQVAFEFIVTFHLCILKENTVGSTSCFVVFCEAADNIKKLCDSFVSYTNKLYIYIFIITQVIFVHHIRKH